MDGKATSRETIFAPAAGLSHFLVHLRQPRDVWPCRRAGRRVRDGGGWVFAIVSEVRERAQGGGGGTDGITCGCSHRRRGRARERFGHPWARRCAGGADAGFARARRSGGQCHRPADLRRGYAPFAGGLARSGPDGFHRSSAHWVAREPRGERLAGADVHGVGRARRTTSSTARGVTGRAGRVRSSSSRRAGGRWRRSSCPGVRAHRPAARTVMW